MPDIPISSLPETTTPASTDVLPVVDGTTTKKVQIANLLSASGGSSLVGFLQAGTGAVARTVQGKLQDVVSVKDFGAVGDGFTNDYAAINAAITAASGRMVFFPDPSVGYLYNGAYFSIPADTRLLGENKRTTKILHGSNNDMWRLLDGASVENLYIDGNGFTGRGLVIDSTDGRQCVTDSRVINFDSACIDFATVDAGSQSSFNNVETYRTSSGTGTGRYAITMAAGVQLSAVPRKFFQIETGGNCSFSFGGCNDVFVGNCVIGDVSFTSNTRGMNMTGSRLLNQAALTLDGANNSIVGCDVLPAITIASGATNNTVGPGSFNTSEIIDNSGNATNKVFQPPVGYTPTITSGGTAPAIGNGSISAFYERHGTEIFYNIDFTVGSTTTLGTGDLRFSLPKARSSGTILESCSVVLNHAGTLYVGAGQIPGNVSYVSLLRDTSGSITFNSPATWGTGDTFRIAGSYYL